MKVVRPTVFPKPGTYSTNKIHINFMSFTENAQIYYTLDGSDPNENSPSFNIDNGLLTLKLDDPDENGRINIKNKDFIIKAKAVKEGYVDSDIGMFHFSLSSLPKGEYFYTILRQTYPRVLRIEDQYQVKMYFVVGSERALLIDGGLDKESNLKELLDSFAEGKSYDAIITHAHPDHDAQAQSLIDQGITVYLNDEELATYDQFGGGLTGFTDFKEGHIFELGNCKLNAYKVPGHTKGHMVLVDEENGLVFASDALGNNRNTLMDTAFIHLGGGKESTMDQFLSVLQNFRYATKGKVKKIFFGHNDNVLNESYLESLEEAVQQAVDLGENALSPTLRPAAECSGSSKISIVGNYISDLDWAGVNIINLYSNNYTSENIATLSAIFVRNGFLEEKFQPDIENYTLHTNKGVKEIEIAAISTSSRVQGIRVNNMEVSGKEFNKIKVEKNKEIVIQVIAPNGSDEKNYLISVE